MTDLINEIERALSNLIDRRSDENWGVSLRAQEDIATLMIAREGELRAEVELLRECEAVVRSIVHHDSMALSQHGECREIVEVIDQWRAQREGKT